MVWWYIIFFFYFQGMTIKPLVRILHVKLRGKEQRSMYAELNEKVHTCKFFSLVLVVSERRETRKMMFNLVTQEACYADVGVACLHSCKQEEYLRASSLFEAFS